jgi:hypothetical protein
MTGVAAAPFLGKPGEAGMQNGSNDGAHDWRSQVQPCIGEIAGGYHRAKRPRRVEGSAGEGASHEDIEGQRHADRQRGKVAGPARDCGAKDNGDQEKGEYGLNPAPSPTTAAVPAPMNTNAQVPMNSARSFGCKPVGYRCLHR